MSKFFIKLKTIIFGLALMLTTNVIPDDVSSTDLIERLNSIESRIKVLEKATFSKTTSGLGSQINLDDYQSIIARQSIQISELQNEIQTLTAKIEELIFTTQSTVNNLNSFREDTEFRFIDINNKENNKIQIQSNVGLNKKEINNEELEIGQINPELQPKSLGTIPIIEDESLTKPEVQLNISEEKQEITDRVSQDNIISIEEQGSVLNVLPEGEEKGQYEYAMMLLKQGDYDTAEKAFTEFMLVGKESDLLSKANFWLAETYYVRENFKDAAKNYLNVYQVYPNSEKVPDALLKLGISLINMNQIEQGCITFIQLKEKYNNANTVVVERNNLEIEKNGCEIS